MKRQGCLFLLFIFLISLQAKASAFDSARRECESTKFTYNSFYDNFIVNASLQEDGIAYFRARLVGEHVYLDWGVDGEFSTSSFVLERKTRKSGFRTIGGIRETGERAYHREYSFKDELATGARPFRQYRIKQKFQDGSFKYHQTISILSKPSEELNIQQEANKLSLTLPKTDADSYQISIYTLSGYLLDQRNILSNSSQSFQSFNLSEYSPGLLVLIVKAGENRWIKKVIKN